jgi:hypothetical protein
MTVRGWIPRIALLCSAGLVLLGGMVSSQAPLVLRPGWLRARGGTLGAALLLGALLVGGVFGLLNDVTDPFAQPQREQGFPACAREAGVPVPEGFEPLEGPPPGTEFCIATLDANMRLDQAFKRYRSAIRRAEGWNYVKLPSQPVGRQFQADRGQACFSFSFTEFSKRATRVTVIGGAAYCDLARQSRRLQGQQRQSQP